MTFNTLQTYLHLIYKLIKEQKVKWNPGVLSSKIIKYSKS